MSPDTLASNKICHQRPTAITQSVTFVIDSTKSEDPEDIKHDNFGTWEYSGSHFQIFRMHIKDGIVVVDKCAPGATGNDIIQLRRLHSVHPSNKQFK